MAGLGNIDDVYNHYFKVIEENKQLEKKLEIAIEALEYYKMPFNQLSPVYNIAQHHKRAVEALAKIAKIKEIN